MAIKSISDFYSFSLYIFDLDNTIYNEEDYLFQAYNAIAERYALISTKRNKNQLLEKLKELYLTHGRETLFNRFLISIDLDDSYIPECLEILRSFIPSEPIQVNKKIKTALKTLKSLEKTVYVLTNGNIQQQKNKIKHIRWEGLDDGIGFVFANELEPKPSPAGVVHILTTTGIGKERTIFVGDSVTDRQCALKSGIEFIDVLLLTGLPD